MDSIIDYSLQTPKFNNNILADKIINMLKRDNNMIGGSSENFLNISNCLVILVGIIVIIIGFYLCWNKNDFASTNGQIQNLTCESKDYSSQCKFNVIYTVGSTQYSKVITLDKSAAPNPNTNTITVYYQESDPNIMSLYNYNYSVIGIVLIIIGAFILISSICGAPQIVNYSNESQIVDKNLYSDLKSSNGVDIAYSKI